MGDRFQGYQVKGGADLLIYVAMISNDADKSKFERIYSEYRNLMYHIAYQRLKHEQDAEDVAHHVFMKIAENIEKIESVSPKTRQLVVTMVENRIIDLLRVRGRRPECPLNEEVLDYASTQLEDGNLLVECIFQLPEQQRHVIWLKYYHGYNLKEISKMLGISLSWAQKIDQRAKKKLEILYKEKGGEL